MQYLSVRSLQRPVEGSAPYDHGKKSRSDQKTYKRSPAHQDLVDLGRESGGSLRKLWNLKDCNLPGSCMILLS